MDADFLKLPTSITAASKFYKSFAEVSLYTPYETTQALLYEHADGVAAQAFLKMADIPFKFIERPNTEFMSPNGNVPFLKVEQALIPGFTSIVEYFTTCGICLCNGLSEVQVADVKAHIALIQENLKIVELYLMWVNNQIYSQVTRKRYGSVYPWPLNHILPHMKRVEILKYLDCLGWKRKSDERVIELAEKTFKCLDTKLGNSMYFSGSSPTELDALAFGHIYTILTTNLPRFELAECVGRYTNLRKFCQRIDDTFFK